jgi:hypothetical protein
LKIARLSKSIGHPHALAAALGEEVTPLQEGLSSKSACFSNNAAMIANEQK